MYICLWKQKKKFSILQTTPSLPSLVIWPIPHLYSLFCCFLKLIRRQKIHQTFCVVQTFENFEFLKVLGKGTFGKVILCRLEIRICSSKKQEFFLNRQIFLFVMLIVYYYDKTMLCWDHSKVYFSSKTCIFFLNGGYIFITLYGLGSVASNFPSAKDSRTLDHLTIYATS